MGAVSGLHAHRLQGCHVKNKLHLRAHSALFTPHNFTVLHILMHLNASKTQTLNTEIKTQKECFRHDQSRQPCDPVLKAPLRSDQMAGFWTWGLPDWVLRGA